MFYDAMKGSIVVVLLMLFSVALVPSAHACSCIPPKPPLESLEASDAVFAGRVIRIDNLRLDYNLRIVIEVEEQWKGDLGDRVEIITANNSAACGFNFDKGTRYIVYAHRYEGDLHTGLCSRTASLDAAQEDLKAFDAEHLLTSGGSRSSGGICGGSPVASLQALLFIGFGVLWMRRRSYS